ncbi:zinc-binding dehydrogenase [Leucobacter tenebrionis]|uniref:zinc-binding dehydrogenase n=1 Tax=Leucobacter tenebrionis TaxID=2873270 RepID=UPI001CA631A8|nr:alcohol dehydrogenase catalytic domain-containing protein [Leucobacter tenebrionis]QZY51225.1 alcohol dehydrogenase catalytic domain-containing protein [Leucobacter tenebrionis]
MNATAPAIVFEPGAGLRVREVSVRAPRAGEVAVEIRAAGVCHSDLHILNGDWPEERPLVLGHEAAGVVTEVGEGVELQPGDHVVLSWFAPCGRCDRCASGKAWLCTGTRAVENVLPDGGTAFSSNGEEVWPFLGLGAFTGTVVVPRSAAIKVAPELPFEVGALLGCAVTTGVGAAVNTAQVRPGETAVVVGCGGVGLATIMGLRLAGAGTIVAVDLSAERREAAERFGATVTLDGAAVDVVAWCQEHLGGADYAFEAVGSPRLIEQLPAMIRAGGAAVVVGMPPIGAKVPIDAFDLADQGKRILGCNYGSSVAAIDIPRLAGLYLAGRLPLDQLVGATRPLREAELAFEDLKAGIGLRGILIPETETETEA